MDSLFPSADIAAAQAAMRQYKVPASVTLAQWALESAYGRAMPTGSNNPFGIKAGANDPYVLAHTHEVYHGRSVAITARFRKFPTLAAAFEYHAQLIASHPVYKHVMEHVASPNEFAEALTGVYATDPSYGSKLIAIMHAHNLYQYDVRI